MYICILLLSILDQQPNINVYTYQPYMYVKVKEFCIKHPRVTSVLVIMSCLNRCLPNPSY